MPKGDASTTDSKLFARLDKFSRPVTVNELTSRLRWSRGKIDGAINRLQDKKTVAIVKVSFPKGQRMRYIGLPNKPYWKNFYNEMFVEQQQVLVNDSIGVLKSHLRRKEEFVESEIEILRDYQKSVENLQRELIVKNQQIQDLEQQRSRIDPSIVQVIEEHLNLITEAANQQGFSPAELLKNRIPLILSESIDIFSEIVSIVVDDQNKNDDSLECLAARSILRRAGYLDHR